jgi:NAD-specific glutamate dehydrogenase
MNDVAKKIQRENDDDMKSMSFMDSSGRKNYLFHLQFLSPIKENGKRITFIC